jgi:excisionase family DNA binding protein
MYATCRDASGYLHTSRNYVNYEERPATVSEARLLTVREVADRIRSSPESVRRWIRAGKLRAIRPGGTRLGFRVSEEDLNRFLAARVQGESGQTNGPNGAKQ